MGVKYIAVIITAFFLLACHPAPELYRPPTGRARAYAVEVVQVPVTRDVEPQAAQAYIRRRIEEMVPNCLHSGCYTRHQTPP